MSKYKHRRICSSSSGSSSDSSSDSEAEPQLVAARYLAADIAFGLTQRELRLAALLELQEVFDRGLWSTAEKQVQHAIFNDLLVAAQQRDSRARVRQAVNTLLAAAKRVLPQQKRQQLAKVGKQAAVAASRAARKEVAGAQSSAADLLSADADACDADGVMWSDVPLEVVRVILQALDPLSLAAAVCVCRSWYQLATADDCWRQHLHSAFPQAARRLQHQQQQQHQQQELQQQQSVQTHLGGASTAAQHSGPSAAAASSSTSGVDGGGVLQPGLLYQQFGRLARRKQSALLPWRSCRVLMGYSHTLEWCLPAPLAVTPTEAPAAPPTTSIGRVGGGGAAQMTAPGANWGQQARSKQLGVTGQAAAVRAMIRWHPERCLDRQYLGPVGRQGTATPLTPQQAVKWMLGLRASQVRQRDDSDDSDDSSSSSSSSSSSCSEGDESPTMARISLRLWSIG